MVVGPLYPLNCFSLWAKNGYSKWWQGHHWCWVLLMSFFLFIYLVALGLHCCTQAFSSCGKRGLLCRWSVQASHCGGAFVEPGL